MPYIITKYVYVKLFLSHHCSLAWQYFWAFLKSIHKGLFFVLLTFNGLNLTLTLVDIAYEGPTALNLL